MYFLTCILMWLSALTQAIWVWSMSLEVPGGQNKYVAEDLKNANWGHCLTATFRDLFVYVYSYNIYMHVRSYNIDLIGHYRIVKVKHSNLGHPLTTRANDVTLVCLLIWLLLTCFVVWVWSNRLLEITRGQTGATP